MNGLFNSPPRSGASRTNTIWQRFQAAALRAQGGNLLTNPPLALAAAWQASTAYVTGNVVSNSGKLYECYTAGTSAGSGGPTGTGASPITDGDAAWVYEGLPQASAASPLVPTITHFNGADPTGLDNRYLPGSTLTESLVRVVGAGAVVQDGEKWRFPSVTLFGGQSSSLGDGIAGMWAGVEFRTDAPKVAFLWEYPQAFRLFVDGVRVWPGTQLGGTGGGPCGPAIDFGHRKDRLWRVEFGGGVPFWGICVDPASTISYPHGGDAIRCIVLGDSLTGQSGLISAPDVWVNQLGQRMGWEDSRASPIGSTGYTTGGPGSSPKPSERLTDLVDHSPTIGGFAFGYNDGGAGASATTAAALATFQAARAELPGVPLLVWGVPASSNKSLAQAVASENAVFAAVTAAADPLLIPVPVSTDPDPWFTSANVATYLSPDGDHGKNSWHARFAARSEIAVRKIIAARA